jgi:hypothetical protein
LVKAFSVLSFRQVDISKSSWKARMAEGGREAGKPGWEEGFNSIRTVAGKRTEEKVGSV